MQSAVSAVVEAEPKRPVCNYDTGNATHVSGDTSGGRTAGGATGGAVKSKKKPTKHYPTSPMLQPWLCSSRARLLVWYRRCNCDISLVVNQRLAGEVKLEHLVFVDDKNDKTSTPTLYPLRTFHENIRIFMTKSKNRHQQNGSILIMPSP